MATLHVCCVYYTRIYYICGKRRVRVRRLFVVRAAVSHFITTAIFHYTRPRFIQYGSRRRAAAAANTSLL